MFAVISVACALFSVWSRADAASLYISPASGSFPAGSTITVTVRTDTQGQAVNTAEANIVFSGDISLLNVSGSPVFNLQAPGSPGKGSGTAYFAGGAPSPGYNGGSGVVGTMTFRAVREGTATIAITSGKVLLNDGQGTNALSGVAGAKYTIITAPLSAAGGPEVSSATHPDEQKWYREKTLNLSWTRPAGAYGFSFELDENVDTVPDNTLDTTITTTKIYEDLTDGAWYFHIKARGQSPGSSFGPVRHFQILVDETPPEPFAIEHISENIIAFSAEDKTAGIDHYSVLVDDAPAALTATSPYAFSGLGAGAHTISVQAFDRAGNSRTATVNITVSPAGFQLTGTNLLILILLVINFILLVLVIVLLTLLLRKKGEQRHIPDESLAALKVDIDQSILGVKHHIDERMEKYLAKPKKKLKI